LNKAVGSVKIMKNIEAVMRNKKTDDPVCHWTRGFLAGYLSEIIGVNIEVSEIKCLGRGDEYCEFEIKVKTAEQTW
jgi:hypothetical protein